MKRQLFIACILALFFSVNSFAQAAKPGWLTGLEKNISQKEKAWRVDQTLERYTDHGFNYGITLKSGGNIVHIQINRMNNLPNAVETFAGQAIANGNIMGKKATKTNLKNFGDEAILWKRYGSVTLDFRSRDIFVHVFTSSEVVAKRFARYVLNHIPAD